MKRKTKKRLIILVIAIILASNVPILNLGLLARLDEGKLRYSNGDASWTIIEKFNYFSGLVQKEGYKEAIESKNPTNENTEMYRLYRMNPLYFWRWSYYLIVSKDFKYKNWKEIEPNRIPYDSKNIVQEF